MSRSLPLSGDEQDGLAALGRRLRLARLRRNLSMEEVAARAGTTRKSIRALESGAPSVGLALLARVLSILGYPDRLAALMESDPLGEDLELAYGRQRAGDVRGVADF